MRTAPDERLARWLERRSTPVLAFTACTVVLLVLIVVEGLLALMLTHAHRVPAGFLLDRVRSIYFLEDWSVPQMDLGIVGYDPELTYLLRSAASPFTNREFDTTVAGNSAGLRDDEASLEEPEVIVLGDSFAFGWGVERHETFAQVLERETGLKVLNAGMSSYGTAREVLLLERLDLSATRVVVIQYFMNDYRENRAFVDAGFTLAITPEQEFLESVREFERQTTYWPLDYLAAFLDRRSYFPELETVSPQQVAETCLQVLDSSDELQDLPILFLQIDPWNHFGRHDVTSAISEVLETEPDFSSLSQRLSLVSLEGVLGVDDFFRLDPHLRPSGHRKVAAELEKALTETQYERQPSSVD